MEQVECVVVGAGVIGLAIARQLAAAGHEVLVLEAEPAIGTATSARNSEVIHAGLYYSSGSLKAQLCVQGRDALYRYCAERGIEHRRCGKLVVASDPSQLQELERLRAQARSNGVFDLQLLGREGIAGMEPEVAAIAGLLSPSTGIIDSHGLMLALLGDAEAAGAMLALRAPVTALARARQGFELQVGGAAPMRLITRLLVNATGHGAPPLAASLAALAPGSVPGAWFAKGSYFSLATPTPFQHLVYPLPEPGGLGVHLTLDLAGRARFGPDVEWVDGLDYACDPSRADGFYAAIRRYWPGLPDGALQPAYCGVRPKISGPGQPAADFRIDGPRQHGLAGLVNLFGIESPGLTASLAIAAHVHGLLREVEQPLVCT